MGKDLINIKWRQESVGKRTYRTKYIAEITHSGLNDYKVLTANDKEVLKGKVDAHVAKLEERWDKKMFIITISKNKEDGQKEADKKTKEAMSKLKEIDNILLSALEIKHILDWEQLKDKTIFKLPNPEKELSKLLSAYPKPAEPVYLQKPARPTKSSYEPRLSIFDRLFKTLREKKINKWNSIFEEAVQNWAKKCEGIEISNKTKHNEYQILSETHQNKLREIKEKNSIDVKKWEQSKCDFIEKQKNENAQIETLKLDYMNLDARAVLEYCDLVLSNSEYPDEFPKSFEMDYNGETKILIIEYSLPAIEQLPTLSEVRFIKNNFKEYNISESQSLKMFDKAMYDITLRSMYELFEADQVEAIDAISFNGWVNALNKATGKWENNCILSIQVKKSDFIEIELKNVDSKTCFKNFRGVGSSKLSGLTPIQPILQINRTDKRFTNHYDVAETLDSKTNLASMDWEDFEHLIREVFAKEFSSNGGEVKVTQASRDGGVDAIAFDPDPIRGGKIVIQAKRYTNTVGISAVRDLFGTVMNEGATKGILVTTADYGPDAYDFVKGKPLTLMNGANLLYLLEKHGHHAKIDIKEAKKNMR
jgi:restriction system protein